MPVLLLRQQRGRQAQAGQLAELVIEIAVGHPAAAEVEEERRRGGLRPAAISEPGVVAQRPVRGRVQRHFALLGLPDPDVQRAVVKVDVVAVKASASPSLRPVLASSPITVPNRPARTGGVSCPAAFISVVISSGE